MQPDRATNNGGRTMEVVAAAPRCQLLLIMLMAAMLLPGMKGSPLLVQRTVTRTFELQESIGKESLKRESWVYITVPGYSPFTILDKIDECVLWWTLTDIVISAAGDIMGFEMSRTYYFRDQNRYVQWNHSIVTFSVLTDLGDTLVSIDNYEREDNPGKYPMPQNLENDPHIGFVDHTSSNSRSDRFLQDFLSCDFFGLLITVDWPYFPPKFEFRPNIEKK
ncbi:hypothetical protein STEG23_018851, partial [Scotinomys teguina]